MSYLSRKSAAKYLDISLSTFDEIRKAHPAEFEAFLINGIHPRWTETQLDAFAQRVKGNYSPKGGRRAA
jgi:hypothetical protein